VSCTSPVRRLAASASITRSRNKAQQHRREQNPSRTSPPIQSFFLHNREPPMSCNPGL
jgi:hypothetical protein